MNAPSPTAIVPVERLTSHGQAFRCEPYHATMSAGTCLARRAALQDNRRGKGAALYPKCCGCALGASVAAVLGDAVKVTCVHESGCAVEVRAVRPGLRPLCPAHRIAEGAVALKVVAANIATARAAYMTKREATTRPPCAVKGCEHLAGHTRRDTPAWGVLCCQKHRDTGRKSIMEKRATVANVVAYMSEGSHYGRPRTRARRLPPVDAKAVVAVVAVLRPLAPAMRARVIHEASVRAARGAAT